MKNAKLSLQKINDLTVVECFEKYIDNCIIKNLSPETIKLYQTHFDIFLKTLDDPSKPMSEISIKDIEHFILEERKKQTCNEITINSYLRGVRAFLYSAMKDDYLPSFTITIPKATKKIKETYQDNELKILLKKPNLKTSTFSEYKIWVLSNYLLATGNRLSSALNLQIRDLDFQNHLIQINKTKNRKAQIIPMSDSLYKILREYLKYRKGNSDDFVFCNTRGGKADLKTYQDMLAKYNRSRGVEKTSAHLYRHTFAKKWIMNGGDIFRLQRILGHSDINVVKEYVQMFGKDLSVDFDKFNPLDQLNLCYTKAKLTL